MSNAFNNAKRALANATQLTNPHCDVPISLTSNASDCGVGAVFEQFVDGSWQSLAFSSKQLRKPELIYSTFDRKLLALYLGIRHFWY